MAGTSSVVLGAAPESLTLVLVDDADFVSGLDSADGDWPTGAAIALTFNDTARTTWAAAIDGAHADWNVDKAAVSALIDDLGNAPRVRLTYTEGDVDLIWATGTVSIRRGF